MTLTVVLVVSHVLITPYYMTNDDVGLRSIFEGFESYYLLPRGDYVPYFNVVYTKILFVLYDLFPTIPWYDYLFLGLNVVSVYGIVYLLNRTASYHVDRAVIFVAAVTIFCIVFVSPQFTLTATVVATGGMAALAFYMLGNGAPTFALAFAVFSIFTASLIRIEAVGFVILACSILAIPVLPRVPLRRLAVVVAGLAVSIAVSGLAEVLQYRVFSESPGYARMEKEVLLMAGYTDFSVPFSRLDDVDKRKVTEILEESPLEPDDLNLLRNWFPMDPSIPFAEYERVLEKIEHAVWRSKHSLDKAQGISARVISHDRAIFISILALMIVGFAMGRTRAIAYALYCSVAFAGIFLITSAVFKQPPFRIYYSIVIASFVFMGLGFFRDAATSSQKARVPALLWLALFSGLVISENRDNSLQYWPYAGRSKSVLSFLDDKISYVAFGAVLPLTKLVFPYQAHLPTRQFPVVQVGWTRALPAVKNAFFDGESPAPYYDAVCRENRRLLSIVGNDRDVVESLENVIRSRYDKRVAFVREYRRRSYEVLRCVDVDGASGTKP